MQYKGESGLRELWDFTHGRIRVISGGFLMLFVTRDNIGSRAYAPIYPGDIVIEDNEGHFFSCNHFTI
jgi:hypothetical protein